MIDTHCHIDQYDDPVKIVQECERKRILTIGVTNLPSHFELGYPHVLPYKKVRLALGMHPLYATLHSVEYNTFIRNISKTSYIGEVGLDYSREGIGTKDIQVNSFTNILKAISGQNKLVSVHSRRAEKDVLEMLIKYKIKSAIFHWYSGPIYLIQSIVEAGYYFSINFAMTKSRTGTEIIKRIPLTRILTESDGPYILVNGQQTTPSDVGLTVDYLSKINLLSFGEVESKIESNFKILVSNIK